MTDKDDREREPGGEHRPDVETMRKHSARVRAAITKSEPDLEGVTEAMWGMARAWLGDDANSLKTVQIRHAGYSIRALRAGFPRDLDAYIGAAMCDLVICLVRLEDDRRCGRLDWSVFDGMRAAVDVLLFEMVCQLPDLNWARLAARGRKKSREMRRAKGTQRDDQFRTMAVEYLQRHPDATNRQVSRYILETVTNPGIKLRRMQEIIAPVFQREGK